MEKQQKKICFLFSTDRNLVSKVLEDLKLGEAQGHEMCKDRQQNKTKIIFLHIWKCNNPISTKFVASYIETVASCKDVVLQHTIAITSNRPKAMC